MSERISITSHEGPTICTFTGIVSKCTTLSDQIIRSPRYQFALGRRADPCHLRNFRIGQEQYLSRGTITFGGIDHRQLPLDELRANTAYVAQDPVLFEGTIRWNLALGSVDPSRVTEKEIQDACEKA